MDFLKRAAEAITHSEERAAIAKEREPTTYSNSTQKEEVIVAVPTTKVAPTPVVAPTVVSATSEQVTAVTGEAEITTMKAATVDTVSRAPVIDETIIQEQREIIQPVIHREIEKTEIRHVIQPVYQEETTATQIHERTLPAEYRGEFRAGPDVLETLNASATTQPTVVSTTAAAQVTTVVNEAIVHEIIKPHIIEEVQPVIHRTVHEPHIIHERKDIYEKIVEAPVEIIETRAPIYEKEVLITENLNTKVDHREAF